MGMSLVTSEVGVLHKAINMLLLLRDSLRCLCVLCGKDPAHIFQPQRRRERRGSAEKIDLTFLVQKQAAPE